MTWEDLQAIVKSLENGLWWKAIAAIFGAFFLRPIWLAIRTATVKTLASKANAGAKTVTIKAQAEADVTKAEAEAKATITKAEADTQAAQALAQQRLVENAVAIARHYEEMLQKSKQGYEELEAKFREYREKQEEAQRKFLQEIEEFKSQMMVIKTQADEANNARIKAEYEASHLEMLLSEAQAKIERLTEENISIGIQLNEYKALHSVNT